MKQILYTCAYYFTMPSYLNCGNNKLEIMAVSHFGTIKTSVQKVYFDHAQSGKMFT